MKKFSIRESASAKEGLHHWLAQRISAIALIPLVIWFAVSVMLIARNPVEYLPVFFAYPFNAVMSTLFIGAALYHGMLGIQVIIEDYMHCKTRKYFYLILTKLTTIAFGTATIIAIVQLHLAG